MDRKEKQGTGVMILEELIYKRLAGSVELAGHLATFNGAPAVFTPEPPDDSQEGWGSSIQYPRVIYNFDLQANEERHSAGVLEVSLLCQNTADIMPEAIEPLVRGCLRDVVLKPSGGIPYCFAWARTDAFTIDGKKGNVVTGSGVRFDILQYPSQETSDPDPVMALNSYIKKLYPGCIVMGHDRMEEITEASARRPVIYCRLVSAEKSRETNTVAWMDARMAVHILCPDSSTRTKIAADISNSLSLDGEVIMLDHSPMYIKRLQADYKSDYLESGQVFITGHYGILRYHEKKHVARDAGVKFNRRYPMEQKEVKNKQDVVTGDKDGISRTAKGTSKAKNDSAVYTAGEFAANARTLFGTSPDCVSAALRMKGITKCSKDVAAQAVKEFTRRKV